MTTLNDIDRIHLIERLAFVLRGRCNPNSSDRDKVIALCWAGFKFNDIAEHFQAAERRAWPVAVDEPRSRGSITGKPSCDSRGQSPS